LASGSGGLDASPPPAVFAVPFLGWLALADAVGETAPAIAELMTVAAYLARSALEERIPSLIGSLGDLLTTSGFSSGAVDDVHVALLADRLAFKSQAVTEELAACHADLGEEGQLLSGDEPLVEAVIAAFLDSDVAGPDARAVYDEMAARAAQYSKPHWWASCSLDLPSVLGAGQPPIHCEQPRFRFSDRLVALEWTYGGRTFTGFDGKVTGRGPVGTVDAGGYRDSIDQNRVNYYWNTLDIPSTAQAFRLDLSDGRTWRWANRVARFLDGQGANIRAIMASEVHVAQVKINDLLTAAKFPAQIIHPLLGLMVSAAQALFQVVSKVLVKSLSDRSLTTWAIWHTAVMGHQAVPISVFMLAQPGEATAGLQELTHGGDGSSELTASDDYDADPVFLRKARFMIGESELPRDEFDNGLFKLTARTRQPVAWREPHLDRGGFRILVPHRAPGTKASYVSALRVDVQVGERPKRMKHYKL